MARFIVWSFGLVTNGCRRVGPGSLPSIINIRCWISFGGSHCGGSQIQSSVRLNKYLLYYVAFISFESG